MDWRTCPITREQAIDEIICNDIGFTEKDIGTPAMEFYIKDLMEQTDSFFDIDRHAHLNTLFGYDIGFDAAMQIENWLWNPEANGEAEYEAIELDIEDKELLMRCNAELNLGLPFDKFRTEKIKYYEFF